MAAIATLPLPSQSGVDRIRISNSDLGQRSRQEHPDAVTPTPSADDPLRILAPGQKKLTTIESQRVLAVMDEVMKKLDNVMTIPVLISSLERYSVSLGAELVEMLKEYGRLASEYNRLYEPQRGGFASTEPSTTDVYGSDVESAYGSARWPARLEPLEANISSASMESRCIHIQSQLRHLVKCILREMNKTPSTSTLAPTASAKSKNRGVKLLQDEMRSVVT